MPPHELLLFRGSASPCLPSHTPDPQPLSPRFRCATNGPGATPSARDWLSENPGRRSWTTRDKVPENPFGIGEQEPKARPPPPRPRRPLRQHWKGVLAS